MKFMEWKMVAMIVSVGKTMITKRMMDDVDAKSMYEMFQAL